MDGLFLVNKPQGVSSRKVGVALQQSLSLKKVGHVGTLDVEASGLLLILSNSATRLQNYFLSHHKRYEGRIILGASSDTDDVFGNVHWHPQRDEYSMDAPTFISDVKKTFSPQYFQKPSIVSSKKVDGVTSRALVSQGIIPELKECAVQVTFNSLTYERDLIFSYDVTVSSGFYVRALARDMGNMLGIGGVAESIKRTHIGPFSILDALMPEVENSFIRFFKNPLSDENYARSFIPISKLHHYISFPILRLDQDLVSKFKLGNKHVLDTFDSTIATPKEKNILITDHEDSFIGIVTYDTDEEKFRFGVVI